MKFDIETLGLINKKHSKLLAKCKILDFLSKKHGTPISKSEISKHITQDFNNTYKGRVVYEYLEELEDEGLVIRTSDIKPRKYTLPPNLSRFNDVDINKTYIKEIRSWIKVLEVYDHVPFIFDLIFLLKNRIEEHGFNPDDKKVFSVVEFETFPIFKGLEHFSKLHDSIDMCEKINFTYISFNREQEKEYKEFQPYLLKEHKKRWYLIGKSKNRERFVTFALDRIKKVEDTDKTFKRINFDLPEKWKHSMGIYSNWEDNNGKIRNKPINISFKIKDGKKYKNIDYLKTSKIHYSQKITKNISDNIFATVSLKMFPDTDLVRTLRSFGLHNVKDVKPEFFSTWVFEG